MPDLTEQISRLETGIAALEASRPTLGDAVVDETLAPLRAQLSVLRGQQRTDAQPSTETPGQLLARLQSYLPKELADKMLATGRIEGERRQVTVLFRRYFRLYRYLRATRSRRSRRCDQRSAKRYGGGCLSV